MKLTHACTPLSLVILSQKLFTSCVKSVLVLQAQIPRLNKWELLHLSSHIFHINPNAKICLVPCWVIDSRVKISWIKKKIQAELRKKGVYKKTEKNSLALLFTKEKLGGKISQIQYEFRRKSCNRKISTSPRMFYLVLIRSYRSPPPWYYQRQCEWDLSPSMPRVGTGNVKQPSEVNHSIWGVRDSAVPWGEDAYVLRH